MNSSRSENSSYGSRDPVVIKDTGDVVVYQYPADYEIELYPPDDDRSLAAKDALALDNRRYHDRDRPRTVEDSKRKRRRQILMIVACLLFVAIIVLTSVMSRNDDSNNNSTLVGVGSGVNSAEGENISPTVSPIFDVEVTTTESPTPGVTTTLPTSSPTTSFAMSVLEPIVHDPSLLSNPTTSEGRAFAAIASSPDPNMIIQQYTLLTLFFASNGDGWVTNTGWNDQTTSSDPCSWYGIGCDEMGVVKNLSLCKLFSFAFLVD
jgi:hypothetical protein